MALTKQDLKSIGGVVDKKLDEKLDEKFVDHLNLLEKRLDEIIEEKFDEKLAPINDFIEFAEPAIKAILEESQQTFEQKLPQRVSTLENLHLGTHTHVN